jgi:enamine deaminase RidA (YjgF/YER057c/UK114 family)
MVMIYITDIANKPEFNRAWDEWVDRSNLPLRAWSRLRWRTTIWWN